jgi:SIR2-like domain
VKTGMDDGDWEILIGRVRDGKCTPFLGAGASAHILPTGTTLAARWANELAYPLPERDDLARVAQYIAITRGDLLHPKELVAKECTAVNLAGALQSGDCYDLISGLELPIYITTNYDDLLLQALINKRKQPQVLLCPWNASVQELAKKTYTYEPTAKRPAVYYLHGSAQKPSSIVLTEDDYLDFIVWVTRSWKLQAKQSYISPAVKYALAETSLLFIGYSQNDWTFRVLMRSIRQTGANLGALNVAVQLRPLADDATAGDQEKVEDYLTKYFTGIQNNPVRVYWGTADDFMIEFKRRLKET